MIACPRVLVNPMLRSDYCPNQESTGGSNKRDHFKSQQDRQCYLSAAPSQETTGGLNKRSHSRDSREMAVRGKGNYVLTGESQHKASSLYTTTCGYVEQTQSKMGAKAMGGDGLRKTRSRATRREMHRNVKQRSTEMKHEPDRRQEPIRNRK